MKKIFTLCLGLVAALAVQAQSDFPVQFADKDGNIIADGTTLDLTEVEETDFGEVQMPTGLYVKNVSGASVHVGGVYTIQSISSGAFQSCPFGSCTRKDAIGQYTTANDDLAAGSTDFLMSEWFPTAEGTCVVTYQLLTYKQNSIKKTQWDKDKDGPTITLNFNYSSAAISKNKADGNVRQVEYISLTGRRVQAPAHGMYIVKTTYADGTTKSTKKLF